MERAVVISEGDRLGERSGELIREGEALVDTVLVATSSKQLKDLWSRFDTLLGIEPTAMQRQVLTEPEPMA